MSEENGPDQAVPRFWILKSGELVVAGQKVLKSIRLVTVEDVPVLCDPDTPFAQDPNAVFVVQAPGPSGLNLRSGPVEVVQLLRDQALPEEVQGRQAPNDPPAIEVIDLSSDEEVEVDDEQEVRAAANDPPVIEVIELSSDEEVEVDEQEVRAAAIVSPLPPANQLLVDVQRPPYAHYSVATSPISDADDDHGQVEVHQLDAGAISFENRGQDPPLEQSSAAIAATTCPDTGEAQLNANAVPFDDLSQDSDMSWSSNASIFPAAATEQQPDRNAHLLPLFNIDVPASPRVAIAATTCPDTGEAQLNADAVPFDDLSQESVMSWSSTGSISPAATEQHPDRNAHSLPLFNLDAAVPGLDTTIDVAVPAPTTAIDVAVSSISVTGNGGQVEELRLDEEIGSFEHPNHDSRMDLSSAVFTGELANSFIHCDQGSVVNGSASGSVSLVTIEQQPDAVSIKEESEELFCNSDEDSQVENGQTGSSSEASMDHLCSAGGDNGTHGTLTRRDELKKSFIASMSPRPPMQVPGMLKRLSSGTSWNGENVPPGSSFHHDHRHPRSSTEDQESLSEPLATVRNSTIVDVPTVKRGRGFPLGSCNSRKVASTSVSRRARLKLKRQRERFERRILRALKKRSTF